MGWQGCSAALAALLALALAASGASAFAPQPRQQALQDAGAAAAAASSAAAPLPGARVANGGGVIKPATPVWPQLFKAVLFQNRSSSLALTSLYYDWKGGRNLNLIQTQLGARGEIWDVEHDNGTSFIFSRSQRACKRLHFDVGILLPNWLEDATPLGQTSTDGFVVDVWTKAEFINYYNDNSTSRPVRWTFLSSGAEFHVMDWTPGRALAEEHWQAPAWCFTNETCVDEGGGGGRGCAPSVLDEPIATGRLMRPPSPAPAAAEAAAGAGARAGAAGAGVAAAAGRRRV
ncbi:transferring glycosyl group transferase [Raphidocelis subcapitata]|uniref:Transferring glycosyl group transferase n=1 Tax=Raphidocelis subcapitata TaxID=307507 RepID=A0A2V0P6V2_9CHLO|nr:transferring glycosyl group transferase [Raphidocelis subcapitata]|eukprot:GBF95588.1 transferring glycosyl group transferase [Raphidocelis subcapitata]